MTIQWSTTVRNARLAAIPSAIGESPWLQLFTGAAPATCASSETGTLLAEIQLATTWTSVPVSGSMSLTNLPISLTGITDGSAGHYRIVDSTKTTCHEQGSTSVAGYGGDLIVDYPTVTVGRVINIVSFSKTESGI